MATRIKKPKVQRIKFSQQDVFEEYFEEMKCLACVSTMQPFQFVHTLNMLLDRNFRREMELMQDKTGREYKVYFDSDPMRSIDYNIICNRNRTEFLIPELLNSDYLILMHGMQAHPAVFNSTLKRLQSHKRITYSYDFDPMDLKSKEYLVL